MQAPPRRGVTGRRVRALVATLMLSASGMLPAALTGAMAVQLRESLNVSSTQIGAAISLFFAAGSVAAFTVGHRIDRIGWRRTFHMSGTLGVISLLGAGLLAHDWLTLTVFLLAGGFAFSLEAPASNIILSREMPPSRLGLVLGIKQTSIPAATLLAGIAVPAVALTIGWRWAYVIAVVVPLTALLTLPSADNPRVRGATAAGAARGPRPRVEKRALTGIAMFFASMIPGALTAFYVVTVVDAGLSVGAAGGLLAVASALGVLARPLSGWLVDRSGSDGYRPVALLLLMGALGMGLIATGRLWLIALGGILGFVGGWGWPGVMFYAVVRANPLAPGAATGAMQVGGMTGSALGPVAFGLLAESASSSAAWATVGLLAVLAAILALRARPTPRPRAVHA